MSKKSEQSEEADLKKAPDLEGRVKALEATVKLLESQVEGLKNRSSGKIPEPALNVEVDMKDPEGSDVKVRLLRNYFWDGEQD